MKRLFTMFILLSISLIAMSQHVEVMGAIKIVDGSQGENKVLTSDANGLASWKASSAPSNKPYYQSVKIACISWMNKNLDVVTYRNGDSIPKIEDAAQWASLTTGAYCYFNNDSTTYAATYGKLYNWYAVNDARGLAPEGWHVPTKFEWTTTLDTLRGAGFAGFLMKESGLEHWENWASGGSDYSGFAGLPGGYRELYWDYGLVGRVGNWHSSSAQSTSQVVSFTMVYNSDAVQTTIIDKSVGSSVRCVKD